MPEREEPPVPLDLDKLYPTARLPADLEDQVVAELKARSMLGSGEREGGYASGERSRVNTRGWIQAAAAVVLFAAGWLSASAAGPPPDGLHRGFMLLMWQGADFAEGKPSDVVASEYGAWMREVSAPDLPILGRALASHRTMVGAPSRSPEAESSHVGHIGGFFVIQVDSETQALELARSHPHLSNGGWIEVVQIAR